MNHPNPTPEVAAGTRRLAALAKIAVTYGVLLLVWSPALGSDRVNDSFQDWSYAAEYKSYAATSLFEFGEVPYFAWQGRHKGHRNTAFDAFFANPETPALSPMLPLYYWLDHEQATRADRQIRLLIGAVGAYVLLSAWLANVSLWALLSFCLLYLGNGALAGHTLVGHGMAGALFALPLIMGLFLRAANRNHAGLFPAAAVACGGLLALMVYDGASHFLTHFLLFLGIYSVTACIIEPSRTRPIGVALFATLLSFALLGAYKLFPMVDIYVGYAADYRKGYASLAELVVQLWPFAPEIDFDHEVNSYVGLAGIALFIAACFYWTRKTAPFLVTGFFFLLFTWLPVADWLAQHAPFFETQGVFSRFRIGFLFAFSCVAAAWVQHLMNRVRRWQPSVQRTGSWVLAGALLVGLAIDLRYQNFERRRETLLIHPYPPIASARIAAIPFGSPEGDVEVRPVARGVNWAQYQYRQLLPDGDPRRILSPALKGGLGHLVFSGDVQVTPGEDGSPALYLTAPRGSFEYEFRQRSATLGGWITGLSLVGLALWLLRWLLHPKRAKRSTSEEPV